MTSKKIVEVIMNDVSNIDIGRFDYNYIPLRSDFTQAITQSIVDTCSRLGLQVILEFNVDVSEGVLKEHKD